MDQQDIDALVQLTLLLAPIFLVDLAGMGIAWLRYRRHRRLSIAIALLLATHVAEILIYQVILHYVPLYASVNGFSESGRQLLFQAVMATHGLIASGLSVANLFLLFSGRGRALEPLPTRKAKGFKPTSASTVAAQPHSSPDDTLLEGVAALHLQLIKENQLVEALKIWTSNRTQSLGEILQSKDWLNAEEQGVLRRFLAVHQLRHGQEITKSLAAFVLSPTMSLSIAKLDDVDLLKTASYIPRVNNSATVAKQDDFYCFPSEQSSTQPVNSSRFRLLRQHARGGLGEVYVAVDQELNREVAVKQIQPRYADDRESRTRFVQEAEITGGLEHPGIVPVYGLGSFSDGRPYYAMRFIRGKSLAEEIEQFHLEISTRQSSFDHGLGFRQLLRRFLDVCNAIEYAHSRSVIHRDLKPSNIMLGKYGETLVVDWGLAKVSGAEAPQGETAESALILRSGTDSTPTVFGQAIGTPAYMSPEQAKGDIDKVDAMSDVYCLGATLYCLLTGRPPVQEANFAATIKKVIAGEIAPPRRLVPAIPRSLDSICMKAMSRDREERYASASELAEDIERWMADEPVSAIEDSWNIRVARHVRKHSLVLTGVVVSILSIFLTTIALFAMQLPTMANTGMEIQSLRDILRDHQSDVANADVRELTRMVFMAGAPIGSQSSGEKSRAYKNAIRIQRALVDDHPGVRQLRMDLADFYQEAAHHSGITAAFEIALEDYQKSIELRQQLYAENPDVPSLRDSLACVLADASWLLSCCPDKKVRNGDSAVALAERAIKLRPKNNSSFLDTLATAYSTLGNFELAIQFEEQAITQATGELRAEFEKRLNHFRERKSFADSINGFFPKRHDF